jgi:hypothetical protein
MWSVFYGMVYLYPLYRSKGIHIRELSNLRAHYRLCHKEDPRPPKKKSHLHAKPYQKMKMFQDQASNHRIRYWNMVYSASFTASSFSHYSPVLLSTQVSNTTTTSQPSRTAGEVPPHMTPPPCLPMLPMVQSTTDESLKFDNNQSRKYFKQEIRDYGVGGKYLVAKSFYRGERKAEYLEEDDVEICLQLTMLVQSLSLRLGFTFSEN